MEVKKRVPKGTQAGYFIGIIEDMKNDLLSKGYEKPFKIISNLEVEKQSKMDNHFYDRVGITEYQRIEEKKWILTWNGNKDLEEAKQLEIDEIILRTISGEDWNEYKFNTMEKGIRKIIEELRKIEDVLRKRYWEE